MILSMVREKASDKIQYPSIIKKIQQTRNKRELPQLNKGHLQKNPWLTTCLMVKD